jgi:uncharacterized protein YeaO (DUF488 family)
MTGPTARQEAEERVRRILAEKRWPTGYPLTDREAAWLRKNVEPSRYRCMNCGRDEHGCECEGGGEMEPSR